MRLGVLAHITEDALLVLRQFAGAEEGDDVVLVGGVVADVATHDPHRAKRH
ncbi:hypothetical protein ACFWWC_34040 [Streptomyces sp. NPDC058642]|uniref:hypothetical protein n=1 Tax=Streptomyces sp. NPDC058642 TaxID=3346572 RepID=UPI0036590CC6